MFACLQGLRIRVLIAVGLMLLGGCSSPGFVNPPPNSTLAPLPAAINGTWANVVENGQLVRLSGAQDGTLRMYFSETTPSENPPPTEPLLTQTMRFDNTDWLLLDFRRMAAWQGELNTEEGRFRLLKYALENPDRLCGTEMDVRVFADAIKSGELAGTVEDADTFHLNVVVTSPGVDWVKWWTALPASRKKFSTQTFCFVRVK